MRSSNLGTASIALSKIFFDMVYCGAGSYAGLVKRGPSSPCTFINENRLRIV